jgi:hypothetical protein
VERQRLSFRISSCALRSAAAGLIPWPTIGSVKMFHQLGAPGFPLLFRSVMGSFGWPVIILDDSDQAQSLSKL